MTFGDALKAARKAAKLSQTQLAEAVGVRQSSIAQVETGKRSGLEADTVFALEKTMRLRAGELVQHLPPDHPAHLKVK
ncbi:helix-turn-helix transcriptional regulator, partial [Bifidobacterium ruminantium]|uniref:helix-turn-helix domain-containing protein n=1 Tax=Bifidobacterium ruminantium TaxID=78346 RepID=UPI00195C0FF8|nr:helix-turn-helix transcriptional regulator [Bifidobacterium ruminantium]